jgi:CHAT domain-containing protein/Tfp pilus assembly protein PilF
MRMATGFAVVVAMLAFFGALPALAADNLDALRKQGGDLYRQGKYKEATAIAEKILVLTERDLGPEHPETLTSVENVGEVYRAQGRYAEAEPMIRRALAGFANVLGPEHLATLRNTNNLGLLYQTQGRYAEAEPLLNEALAGWKKKFGAEHEATLTSLNNLGSLYQRQGRYGEAEKAWKQALASKEKTLGPEHPSTLTSVNNLGFLYHAQGRYAEAEQLLRKALVNTEKVLGSGHSNTLLAINNLAALYQTQGRYGQAEPLYRRALTGFEMTLGPEHPETLRCTSNLSYLLQMQGRYTEAEPLHKKALAGYEKALGTEHPETLKSVMGLGTLYSAQGRYGEAEPFYKRALAGCEKAVGPEHPLTMTSVNNLAELHRKQGHSGEAERLYHRALAGREKALGQDHPDTLVSVHNLAAYYFEQGDWSRAAHLWRRSTATIAQRVQRGVIGAQLTGATKSEAEQSEWQFRELVKAEYRLAPQDQAPGATSAGEMFKTAQWAHTSEAARSLTQMAARGAKGDPSLAALVRERQDLVDEWQGREKQHVAALGHATSRRNAREEAENLERMTMIDKRVAEIDQALTGKFPDYAALASPAPLSIAEAQAQLGADEALVLFLDTWERKPAGEETFIWVLTKTQMRWVRSDLGKVALAREVRALRCGLDQAAWEGQSLCPELTGQARAGSSLPFDSARAQRLYEALFGQVKDLIQGKHLLIVPSGALTQLPFGVLVTAASPAGGKTAWLIRDHAITVLPAVSSLKALRAVGHPSAATKPMIGFGNPLLEGGGKDSPRAKLAREKQYCPKIGSQRVAEFFGFGAGLPPVETRDGLASVALIRNLTPLAETADELCEVASEIGTDPGDIRLGDRATERELKMLSELGELAKYRVLHFATHGAMASELSGLIEPGLIFTPPAEASESDDGYLSASEIAALKLDADLVILSACNTAAGDAGSAEALSGLARAFIYAQARTLLVPHWAVDSNATVKLITASIREIVRNKRVGRAEALRLAMLAMIDGSDPRETHPTYWAPFIVVGEGTARPIVTVVPSTLETPTALVTAPAGQPAGEAPYSKTLDAKPAARLISDAEEAELMKRADAALANNDIIGARLFFEYLANRGSALGAYLLARTYDAENQSPGSSVKRDNTLADHWYRRAAELGLPKRAMRGR